MKSIILFVFIVNNVLVSYTSAQSVFSDQISWGESVELKTNEGYPQGIAQTTNAMYLINREIKMIPSYMVSIFDPSSLKFKGQYKLKFMQGNSSLNFQTYFVFSDAVYFVTSDKAEKANLQRFYLQKLDETGNLSQPQLIASVKFGSIKNVYSAKGRAKIYARASSFKVVQSPDGGSLALLFPNDLDSHEGEDNQWNLVMYDDELKIGRKMKFTITEANIQLGEVALTNDGHIYALGLQNYSCLKSITLDASSISASGIMKSLYPVGSNYFLYHFDPMTNALKATDLDLTDQGVINAQLKVIEEDIICYGFTGFLRKKEVLTEGYFIKKLNLDGEVVFSDNQVVSDEFYKYKSYHEVDTDKSSLKLKKRNFLLGDIFKNDKGDFLFLAQQYKFYISNYGSTGTPGPYGSALNHMSGDIVVISCSNDGALNWTKRYFSSENYGKEGVFLSSYFAQMNGNKLHLLMNDDLYRTNEEKYDNGDKKEKKRAVRDNIISEIILDENGVSERKLLLDIDSTETEGSEMESSLKGKLIAPKSFYLAKNGTLVFFGRYLITRGLGVARQDKHHIRMGRMYLK